MPYLKVYIHFVWVTKNRTPFLNTSALRLKVWWHILKYAGTKGIYIDFINGYSEHCHCLIALKPTQRIEEIIHLIKGESSHWINSSNLLKDTGYSWFEWQEEYYGASVSPADINAVREYIKHQETHHKVKSFNNEFNDYMNQHGFQLYK